MGAILFLCLCGGSTRDSTNVSDKVMSDNRFLFEERSKALFQLIAMH